MTPRDVQLHPSGTVTYREPEPTLEDGHARSPEAAWQVCEANKRANEAELRADERRRDLLVALAALPDEAFSYVAVWAKSCGVLAQNGGFQNDAETALARVGEAATTYLLPQLKPSDPKEGP